MLKHFFITYNKFRGDVMLNYEQIGKQIKIARIQLGVTQEFLAEKVNISAVHLSNIERGAGRLSLKTIVALAKALNTSLDVILCNEINMPNQNKILTSKMADLLSDCTSQELLIITEVAESTKKALRQVYTEEK